MVRLQDRHWPLRGGSPVASYLSILRAGGGARILRLGLGSSALLGFGPRFPILHRRHAHDVLEHAMKIMTEPEARELAHAIGAQIGAL